MRYDDNATMKGQSVSSMEATMAALGKGRFWALAWALLLGAATGCQHTSGPTVLCIPPDFPRELDKASLPAYTVEPPDILLIEAVRAVPKPPYRIESLDAIIIQFATPLPNTPGTMVVFVEPDGTVNLGTEYGGTVRVAGLTLPEAKAAIEKHLKAFGLKNPEVTVALSQSRASQRISGPHLVRPDGTIGLGIYGEVRVSGLTLADVKKAIETHLASHLLNPEVAVDVTAYNSKLVYVILDGGGAGQQVVRLPFTGNETVLDAIAQVNGLAPVSSTNHIWVARPAPAGGPHQVLPVDWRAVSALADTGTNYQLLPGDRVYVAAQHLVEADTFLARLFAPLERVLGITLLGNVTYRSLNGDYNTGTGSGFGTGF
jgi:polysaccharide biosynthesis/export protein